MHNHDDKYPSRPGFEPGGPTPRLQAPVDTNERFSDGCVFSCEGVSGEESTQCWFDVGPPLQTMAQHRTNSGWNYRISQGGIDQALRKRKMAVIRGGNWLWDCALVSNAVLTTCRDASLRRDYDVVYDRRRDQARMLQFTCHTVDGAQDTWPSPGSQTSLVLAKVGVAV